jgi:N-acetylmuramoyl-L-alanine amidase
MHEGKGGDFMRKTVSEQVVELIPIIMVLLICINVFIFVAAADQFTENRTEAAGVSGVVETAAVQDIESIEQEYFSAVPDTSLKPLEPDIDLKPDVSLAESDAVKDVMKESTAVKDEFGCDAASLEDAIASALVVKTKEAVNAVRTVEKQHETYKVAKGDNLYTIAEMFGTTVAELVELNNLETTTIHVNQALVVPADTLKEYPVGLKLTDKEVEWIAQMIHAEARGEPYLGQVAVGAVIINRIKSSQFPNTVRGVLFQEGAFQPIRNGSFYRPASEQAYRAALEALNGNDPTNGALFFFNPKLSNDRFMHSRTPVVTIGQHRFTY